MTGSSESISFSLGLSTMAGRMRRKSGSGEGSRGGMKGMGGTRMSNGAVECNCCEAVIGREVEASTTTKSPNLNELIHRSPQELGVCSGGHVHES